MDKVTVLFLVVLAFSVRAWHRTLDWRDSYTLFHSALKEAPNDMYKGLRLEILAGICGNDSASDKKQCVVYLNDGLKYLNNVLLRKDNPAPEIIKFYGIDEHSEKFKVAYILSYVLMEQHSPNPYGPLEPYIDEVYDTQIVQHYLAYLAQHDRLDDAERLCIRTMKSRKTPPGLIGLSVVQQRKYKNYKKAEEYLIEAHKMFPYDLIVLQELIRFYSEIGANTGRDYYIRLYKLRVHEKIA